jgi:predicted nucleotidyltransferase
VRHYSPADRALVQSTLIDRFARDDRVEGVLVVGSGAHGFTDEYSDLDLAVIVRAGEPAVFALEWAARLESELPVVHRFGDDRGEAGYVCGLLLENFLEVDIGFLRIDQMAERGMPWAIAFDRTGAVERRHARARRDRPRATPPRADGSGRGPRGRSPRGGHSAWNQQPSGLRQAPRDVRDRVEESLPRTFEPQELARALGASARAFFAEARAFEADLDLAIAARLEPVVLQYLDQFDRIERCASR